MATAMNRAMAREGNGKGGKRFGNSDSGGRRRAIKRTMARAARAMATATKRTMATNGDNTGNGYGKEGGGRLMAATMGTVQSEGGDGGNGPWFVCVSWCVWRDNKK
jgi:hypothetical protein